MDWADGVIQVHSRAGWVRLDHSPEVGESDLLVLRHLQPLARIEIGDQVLWASDAGEAELRLLAYEHLRGHVGKIEVRVDGRIAGEIKVVPDKLSQSAYWALVGDLQRTWLGLVLDPDAPSRVSAALPPARELLRQIAAPLRSVLDEPREQLTAAVVPRHLWNCRRRCELTPTMLRRSRLGLAAETRTAVRSPAPAESNLVHSTLTRLGRLALQDGDQATALRLSAYLQHPSLANASGPVRSISWGSRADRRYRQIHEVHRLLDCPELAAEVGPGILRLGVKALQELFELWVFLKVLQAAEQRYGSPVGTRYEQLVTRAADNVRRFELAPGATIEYPGPVFVAYQPRLSTRGDGWMNLEYLPHPDRDGAPLSVTPDVVVYKPAPVPSMHVFDAKYVARHWVEREAARVHDKYARVRTRGTPVVRYVLAIHPHHGLSSRWAGYGHVGMSPLKPIPDLPLPPPITRTGSAQVTARLDSAHGPPSLPGVRPDLRDWLEAVAHEFRQRRPTSWMEALRHALAVLSAETTTIVDLHTRGLLISDVGQVLHALAPQARSLGPPPRPLAVAIREAVRSLPGQPFAVKTDPKRGEQPVLVVRHSTGHRP